MIDLGVAPEIKEDFEQWVRLGFRLTKLKPTEEVAAQVREWFAKEEEFARILPEKASQIKLLSIRMVNAFPDLG